MPHVKDEIEIHDNRGDYKSMDDPLSPIRKKALNPYISHCICPALLAPWESYGDFLSSWRSSNKSSVIWSSLLQ